VLTADMSSRRTSLLLPQDPMIGSSVNRLGFMVSLRRLLAASTDIPWPALHGQDLNAGVTAREDGPLRRRWTTLLKSSK
jgi:hypothetical protein